MIRLSAEAEPEIYATTKRFGTVLENVVMDPVTRELDLDDASLRREQPRRLSDRLHPQFVRREHGSGAEQRGDADRRCVRRAAADRPADAGPGDVPLPLGLHRQGRGHRDRRDRARSDLLDLLRRAVHAAPSVGLRQSAQEADRRGRGRLLAGQHRLDRRQIRRRQAHADQGDARAAAMPRSTAGSRTPKFRKDPNFGFDVPVAVPGVDSFDPRPARYLGRQGRLRPHRGKAGRPVRRRTSPSSRRTSTRASDNRVPGSATSATSGSNRHQLRPGHRIGPFNRTRSDDRISDPRIFKSDAEIEHIGEGLLARTLPRAEWTHEAHLAATTWLPDAPRRTSISMPSCPASSAATMRASAG